MRVEGAQGQVAPGTPVQRTRIRRWSNVLGAWVVAAIFVAVDITSDPLGAFAVDGHLTLEGWLYSLIFLVAPVVTLQLLAAPLLEITDGDWTIRNPLRTWSFPERCVTGLSDSPWGYPQVHLQGGTTVLVGAMEETNLSAYLGTNPMLERLQAEHNLPTVQHDQTTADIRKTWSRPYWGACLVALIWIAHVAFVLIHGPYGIP
jgi:hypothetical protein